MNKQELEYIEEPDLLFAYNQKAKDPRDGLLLFGPFENKTCGKKNVGIIGPERIRNEMRSYLKKLHHPIINTDNVIARPNFPGIESIFNVSINLNTIAEIEISESSIRNILNFTDAYQRVYRLVDLFVERLREYTITEELPIDIWLVVIPEDVYKYCRPKSHIPNSPDNIKTTLTRKERKSQDTFLFDDMQNEYDSLKIAYNYDVDFHNQLKARLLELKIVTQIIRESKIIEDGSQKKFDTVKAWNISTAIYYKLGSLPWKLGDIREGVCYLGLVYKQIPFDTKNNACCAAQMFLDSGDGMIFRGNVGPWWNPDAKEFHLRKKDAEEIINNTLESYKSKFGEYPKEVFIHSKTYFNNEEWEGFSTATENKCKIIGVRISTLNPFKLYRNGKFCVPRGTMLQLNSKSCFLWTKGFIPRFKTQLGLETPNPIKIDIIRGEGDIHVIAKDILCLTKLNYNACIYGDGLPVTLKFADSIGEILTAGKDLNAKVLPFKHYI